MKKHLFLIFCLSIVLHLQVQTRVIGSNTTSSRQKRSFFPAEDDDNKITGFTVCENGITLENKKTLCSYDAFFPLSGDIVLNGGALSLQKDFSFKTPFQLSVGKFLGNGFSVEFPGNISSIYFPNQHHEKLLTQLDQKNAGEDVFSIDWSYDDKYLAVTTDGHGSVDELQIYYFDGEKLTLTLSQNFDSTDVNAVAWHPNSYYLATGAYSGTELKIWFLDVSNGTLQEVDSANTGRTYAIGWNPTGDHIAVSTDKLSIYPFSNDTLGSSIDGTFPSKVMVSRNALDWNSSGEYIAVGCSSKNDKDILIFEFDGNTATVVSYLELGQTVYDVSWYPNSTLLTVGLSRDRERLRMYEFNRADNSLSEIATARVDLNRVVYSLAWQKNGIYLAVVKQKDSLGYELEIYTYDSINKSLHLVGGHEFNLNITQVAWAHNSDIVVTGDYYDKVTLFSLVKDPFILDTVSLFFNSDVFVQTAIHINNDCTLNGGKHFIDLTHGSLVVNSGASLILEDVTLKGLGNGNIVCADHDASILIRDSILVFDNDLTFSVGSLQFQNEVVMSGDYQFSYQSMQTSTLLHKSKLLLDIGFTFSYDAPSPDSLYFEDETAKLILNGATLHATLNGLNLKKGKAEIRRDSYLSCELLQEFEGNFVDNGISFGDRTNANDFACEILSGITLQLNQGSLHYKNKKSSSWIMESDRSYLRLQPLSRLKVFENMNLGSGILKFANMAILSQAKGIKVIGSISPEGRLVRHVFAP